MPPDRWVKLHVGWEAEVPATLRFPTLGLECAQACDREVPAHQIVPALIEPPLSTTGGSVIPDDALVGAQSLGDGLFFWSTQHVWHTDDPAFGTASLIVRIRDRHMDLPSDAAVADQEPATFL